MADSLAPIIDPVEVATGSFYINSTPWSSVRIVGEEVEASFQKTPATGKLPFGTYDVILTASDGSEKKKTIRIVKEGVIREFDSDRKWQLVG